MFDNLPGMIWFDGQFVPWAQANIHIMTHSLHYGSSVFEGIRSYNGALFKAAEHYERLFESAAYLELEIPYTIQELLDATEQLIQIGQYQNGYVRAIVWRGSKSMKVSNTGTDTHIAIGAWERPTQYPEHYYSKGITMNVASWRKPDERTAPVHSKSAGLYVTLSLSKAESERKGFQDALMLDCNGNIAEATSANIFLVVNGKILTPAPECFLNGITRRTCIEVARKLGFEVQETKIALDKLSESQEVFLSGTAVEILPVGSIAMENKNTWSFTPGPITSAVHTEFNNTIKRLCDF